MGTAAETWLHYTFVSMTTKSGEDVVPSDFVKLRRLIAVPSVPYVKRVVDAPADEGLWNRAPEPVLTAASRVHPRPMSTRRMIICGDTHCENYTVNITLRMKGGSGDTHGEHDIDRQEKDRERRVDAERDDVGNPEARIRQHGLNYERRRTGVCLGHLAPECRLHPARDEEDARADEHRAGEVEADDYGRVGERDLRRLAHEEVRVGHARGVTCQNTEGYRMGK